MSQLRNQSICWNRGEVLTLPFSLLAEQYPVGTSFSWKFQVASGVDFTTLNLNVTGDLVVSSLLTLTVPITEANSLATPEGAHRFSLWDVTTKRLLAEGVVRVGPAQLAG